MERLLIDASTQRYCDPAVSTICNWKLLFGGWGAGFIETVTVTGAPTADTNPCADDVFNLDATVLQVPTRAYSTGGVQ